MNEFQIFVVHIADCLNPDRCVSTDCERIGPPPCDPDCLTSGDHDGILSWRGGVERIERLCLTKIFPLGYKMRADATAERLLDY